MLQLQRMEPHWGQLPVTCKQVDDAIQRDRLPYSGNVEGNLVEFMIDTAAQCSVFPTTVLPNQLWLEWFVKLRLLEGMERLFLTTDVEIIINREKIRTGLQYRRLTVKMLCWESTFQDSTIS